MPASPPLDDRPVAAIFRSPVFNASERFIQTQAAALTRYRPLIVGLEDKGNVVPALDGRTVLAAGARERLAFRLGRVAAMAERLRPHRPALIHAHFATDGLLALPLARALGLPLVTTLHGYDVSRSRRAMLLSGRLSWQRHALFRRRLITRRRALPARLRGASPPRSGPGLSARANDHPLSRRRSRPLRARRRPSPASSSMSAGWSRRRGRRCCSTRWPACPGARLVVIGDGPLRGALERRAAALGLAERALFLGALPPAEVAAWMSRAWLLAAPSVTAKDGDSEGLPTVIVEAAASSLPAIGTHHAGIPEAIADGKTGFLVAERDAAALAERIGGLARLARAARSDGRRGARARRAPVRFAAPDGACSNRSTTGCARSDRDGADSR